MKVREKVKLVIAAVTTVCLLSQTFFVGAASENLSESKLLDVNVEYISARNNMVFSGTMAKKKTEVINVLVAAYGKDVLDFASDSSEEVILKTEKTGGGGEINITLELPERIRENGRNAYHIFGSENRRDGMVFTPYIFTQFAFLRKCSDYIHTARIFQIFFYGCFLQVITTSIAYLKRCVD